jgi:rhodanese-related sulfurtransferase
MAFPGFNLCHLKLMPDEITADLSMKSLLEHYPGARRALFSAFHIGGCQSCSYELEDSLEDVCEKHEINIKDALKCLIESQEHDRKMLISPPELKTLIEGNESFTLLDARTREEYESVALPGARFMTQELQNSLFADKNQERKTIIIDHQGRNVLDQCAWFRGHGLTETYGVEGGIDRYAKEVDSSIPRYRLELE